MESLVLAPEVAVTAEEEPIDIPSVDWWITSFCNLKCDFCYGPEPGNDPSRIERRAIAEQLAAAEGVQTITFCGGEPLVRGAEIFEYARLFKAKGKQVVLNTNGELLEQAIERYLEPGEDLPFDVVGISVEGPTQETHSQMRTGADLAATFRGARLVKTYGKTLKIASVVSGVSHVWLPQMVDFARYELDADVLRLYQYNENGDYNRGQERHHIDKETFDTAVARSLLYAWRMPVRPSDNESQNCLIVDPKGGLSVSNKDGYTLIGNVLEEPVGAIWSRQPEAVRHSVNRNKRWIGATALHDTAGACPGRVPSWAAAEYSPMFEDQSQQLYTMREAIETKPYFAAAVKRSCMSVLPEGLTAAEKEAYWQYRLDELISCDCEDQAETARIAERIFHYMTLAFERSDSIVII